MNIDDDCEPPIVRLGLMPPPPPPPLLHQLHQGIDGAGASKPSCLALLAMSSSSDSSSCSDSDSTSTPSASGPASLACGRCRLTFDTPCAWIAHLQVHRQQVGSGTLSTLSDCSAVLTEVCSVAVAPSNGGDYYGMPGAEDVEDEQMAAELRNMQRQSYLQYHHHQQQQQQQQQIPHLQQQRQEDSGGCSSAVASLATTAAGQEQQFRCPLCGACFCRSQNLESHIRRKHMGAESVVCPDCGKCLSSNSSLKKHLRLHSGETPFSCDFCRSSFRQKWELEKHLDYSHGDKELAAMTKPFQCGLCGRAFLYQNSCNAHRRLHQRTYACPQCGISLLSANDLRRHELAAHQPQQCWPYACHLCPDRFSRKAHLDAHLPVCQGRQRQRIQQQQQQQHHRHHQIGEDPDLLRCLLRAVDSSSASSATLSTAAGVGHGADPPDLSLLDSVLASNGSVDIDVATFDGEI